MDITILRYITFSLLSAILLTGNSHAADFYVNGFESGTEPVAMKPSPIWSLPPSFTKNYGPGNHFEVTNNTSHSGNYSLRFTYQGRNGFCNTCGVFNGCNTCSKKTSMTQKAGINNADFFVVNSGEDLTAIDYKLTSKKNDGPAAKLGRLVYNTTNGYSLWQVTSVENEASTNDRLNVKLLRPGITGKKPEFNAGDKVAIAKQCGVDGTVGNNIVRRSDCDTVISWFTNVGTLQTPGQSIFRRVYLKSEISSGGIHQKLDYWSIPRIESYFPDGTTSNGDNIILLSDSLKGPQVPIVSGLKTFGGKGIYKPGLNGIPKGTQVERGVWYYVEQEFKAESSPGAKDGAYRLWFAKSGEETNTPMLEVTGISLPPARKTSFWGNIQHTTHTVGTWYIDDMKISDRRVGFSDTSGKGHNLAPPGRPDTP